MKRKISLMVILVLLLMHVLTGCSLGKAPGVGDMTGAGSGEGVLKLGVVAKGYGDEYLYALAEAYQEKTGIETVVTKSTPLETALRSLLNAGEQNNDIDVFFDIWNVGMSALATKNYINGYDRAFATLSDIYDAVPEGYGDNKTLEEIVMPYALKASTWGGEEQGFGDGEQYFLCYATGMEGLMYNADLFEKYNLEVPKTTNQMFALMDQMKTINKGSYAVNEDGNKIYPYIYSGNVNYSNYPATAWWAQYDGVKVFELAQEGKNADGVYTVDSAKSVGKLSSFGIVSKLLAQESGYTDPTAYSSQFTDIQMKFLDNQAFMMSNGEWVEREMSGNFKDQSLNIKFMRIPMNSDIIIQCDSVKTEEQLVEVVSYIDGDITTRPTYLSDADLTRLTEARSVYCSEGNQHIAYIPVYSNMVDEAKDFLLFMMSKEGQEIMMNTCYGNMAPLNVDMTTFKGYDQISSLQKSKYEIISSTVGVSLVGNNYSHPMSYAGGVRTFYDNPNMESAFGIIKSSASFMTPEELWMSDYNKLASNWDTAIKNAGVSN